MKKQISREDFLKKGAAALAGVGLLATSCEESEERTAPNIITNKSYQWRMVTTWPPNFPVVGIGCTRFADWVREMSGGRMDIQVYGGGELVPAMEAFDAVSSGAAEMGNGAAYYWAGKAPAAQFFATVPFGMDARQAQAWIASGGGQALWDEVYEPFHVKSFVAGNTGTQMGGWFNREINRIEDFKGLKMRMPGIGAKVLSKVGATAVSVAGGEIYTSLETDVIDATEWIGPYHDYLMGFHKIAKYYYYPGWHEPGTILETMVNRPKFEALPLDLQRIIEAACNNQAIWTLAEFDAKNNDYLNKLKAEGVQLRAFSPEILDILKQNTQMVLEEMVASDPQAKKVYTAYKAFQTQASEWSNVAERSLI
ncbi:TRAP transporter substrate-binding protein [Pontibacter sp. G13]|uniref:TRAP transporter substrate-binding protein n=1 Tax=Pontibacter sp. G13 TaxID=3074898 RepID=UPI00288BD7B0|nr:TRAP transporter substrate-binding protein [Pontibacter sp. G13]WNJ18828.1 TRAP transporter substrate-binding protein [Pontibacter sp. G13]